MKACAHKRKLIIELALDALEAGQARELRTHLESCAGCREYLAEISRLNTRLRAAQNDTDIEASEAFHQRVMRAVRVEAGPSWWGAMGAYLGGARLSWRVALSGVGALAAAIVMLLTLAPRPRVGPQASTPSPARVSPGLEAVLTPSVANYRIAANRSLEQLDELLTQQANKHVSVKQVYTASVAAADLKLSD